MINQGVKNVENKMQEQHRYIVPISLIKSNNINSTRALVYPRVTLRDFIIIIVVVIHIFVY